MHSYSKLFLFTCSVTSDSLWSHGLQYARLLWPSPYPEACSNSCPLSPWCHPTISSSVVSSFCLQSIPVSGSFLMSLLFISCGESVGASASASFLPMNIQDLFPSKLGSNPTSLNSSFLICKMGVRMVILSDSVKIKRPYIETPRLIPVKWWQLFSFQLEKKVHEHYISVFLLMLFYFFGHAM